MQPYGAEYMPDLPPECSEWGEGCQCGRCLNNRRRMQKRSDSRRTVKRGRREGKQQISDGLAEVTDGHN